MTGQGIEFTPDPDDPKHVKITSGLPKGISRAEITYRIPGGLRRTRVVRRSEAEFAHLRTAFDEPYKGSWSAPTQQSLTEAAHYIAQAQHRIALQKAELQRLRNSIDLRCQWCEQQRTYIGVLGFITGHAALLSDAPSELGQLVVNQHAYRCDRCGSMMFFADGYLEHPLPQ